MFKQELIWYNVNEKVPFTAFKLHLEVRHVNGKKSMLSDVMDDIWQSGRMLVKLVDSGCIVFAYYYINKRNNKGWWATETVINSGMSLNVRAWATFEELNKGVIPK